MIKAQPNTEIVLKKFQILELLEHPTLAHVAALAIEIISLEYPGLHLPILKHLFKQKLFQIVLKKLWSKLADFTEHHLTAFVHVLRITPHIVLKMNLEKVNVVGLLFVIFR